MGLDMCLGDRVSWHMYGLGQMFDHHHFSFEGNNFLHENRKLDTASVLPGTGETVIMIPDQAGNVIDKREPIFKLSEYSSHLISVYKIFQNVYNTNS